MSIVIYSSFQTVLLNAGGKRYPPIILFSYFLLAEILKGITVSVFSIRHAGTRGFVRMSNRKCKRARMCDGPMFEVV